MVEHDEIENDDGDSRKRKDKDKDKVKRTDAERFKTQIAPHPISLPVVRFIESLFVDGGFPQRLVVAAVHGPTGARIGPAVKEIAFRPTEPKPTREQIVEISNGCLAAMQQDCDGLDRATRYGILAFDLVRSDRYYSRVLLKLQPSGTSVLPDERNGIDDDEEGGKLNTKLLVGLLQEERHDKRWALEMALNVASGALESANSRIERMEQIVDGTWQKQSAMMAATEQALSRSTDRKIKASWNEMKLAGVRDGISVLKGLLPASIAAVTGGRVGTNSAIQQLTQSLTRGQIAALVGGSLDAPSGGVLGVEQAHLLRRIDSGETALVHALFESLSEEQHGQIQRLMSEDQLAVLGSIVEGIAGAQRNGASVASTVQGQERALLDKFLEAIPDEATGNKLFGVGWQNGAPDEPGILSHAQTLTLARVAQNKAGADALDALLPGGELALTDDQMQRARAILPPTATAAIAELFALRMKARQ